MSKILSTFLAFIIFTLLPLSYVNASQVLFEDDFNTVIPSKWTVFRNNCTVSKWAYKNNKYGIRIGNGGACVTESGPSDLFWDTSWNDYEMEFDMSFISGFDKNIAWRYKDENNWIGIHFLGSAVDVQRGHVVDQDNVFPFLNGQTYRFTIKSVGNKHDVSFYNILDPINKGYIKIVDTDNKYLTGRPVLQASVGAITTSEVLFDNFVIRSVDPQPETFTHFSQNDPVWKDEEYDSASQRNEQGYTSIANWGCALTSSAMILKHFGYDKTPDGEILNPSNLNQYLINNNGYTENGGVIWQEISTFAQTAQASPVYQDKQLNSLEFSKQAFSMENLRSVLDNDSPAIIKLTYAHGGNHFVVAKEVNDQDEVIIHDPLQISGETILSQSYPNVTASELGIFSRSQTDLSYIMAYEYNPQVKIKLSTNECQVSETGDCENGWYEADEGLLSSGVDTEKLWGGGTQGAEYLHLAKPKSGQVELIVSSDSSLTKADVELRLFDQEGKSQVLKLSPVVGKHMNRTYVINFAKEDISQTRTQLSSSFSDLLKLVIKLIVSKDIYSVPAKLNMLLTVFTADKLYPEKMPQVTRLVAWLEVSYDKFLNKGITQHAYDLLTQETGALKESLEL